MDGTARLTTELRRTIDFVSYRNFAPLHQIIRNITMFHRFPSRLKQHAEKITFTIGGPFNVNQTIIYFTYLSL